MKGQIVFAGAALPAPKLINVDNNQDKQHCVSKGPLVSDEWTINKDNKGPLENIRIVAAFPGGSPDLDVSVRADRLPLFTRTLRDKYKPAAELICAEWNMSLASGGPQFDDMRAALHHAKALEYFIRSRKTTA